MSIIDLNFFLSFEIFYLLLFLSIFSFTNGLFLFPASQAILIFGGLVVSVKNVNFFFVFLLLVAANFVGNYILYYLAFRWGEETARKILPMRKKTLDNHILVINYLFKKYGAYIIFVGRNLPVLHSLVSLPAGVAKVDKKTFSIYTLLGIVVWSLFFMYIGIVLGDNYEWFLKKFNVVGSAISLALLVVIVWFFKVYMKKILKLAKEDLKNTTK